jgi:hypothetical protein
VPPSNPKINPAGFLDEAAEAAFQLKGIETKPETVFRILHDLHKEAWERNPARMKQALRSSLEQAQIASFDITRALARAAEKANTHA